MERLMQPPSRMPHRDQAGCLGVTPLANCRVASPLISRNPVEVEGAAPVMLSVALFVVPLVALP
jgi:hypothetical protein